MDNDHTNKCSHIPCQCDVEPGVKFCSDACRDAGDEEVEIACQCTHPVCNPPE